MGDPRPVGDALRRVLGRLGQPDADAVAGIFRHWPDVVGPAVAAHARPARLREGVLTVEVDDPAWAAQLHYLEADLLARLQAVAGTDVVREFALRVVPRMGGKQAPGW